MIRKETLRKKTEIISKWSHCNEPLNLHYEAQVDHGEQKPAWFSITTKGCLLTFFGLPLDSTVTLNMGIKFYAKDNIDKTTEMYNS